MSPYALLLVALFKYVECKRFLHWKDLGKCLTGTDMQQTEGREQSCDRLQELERRNKLPRTWFG